MKKIILSFVYGVSNLALVGILSACSFSAVQPEASTYQMTEAAQDTGPDGDQAYVDTQKREAANPQYSSLKDTAEMSRHQSESDQPKERSSAGAPLYSEQDEEAVSDLSRPNSLSESASSRENEREQGEQGEQETVSVDHAAQKTESSEQESVLSGVANEEEDKHGEPSFSVLQVDTEPEKQRVEDKSAQEKNERDSDKQASDVILQPEALDDGSEGEQSSKPSIPLVSDKDKSGNSNINRKGRDTYLMKEGKPKRFWNLQRQL